MHSHRFPMFFLFLLQFPGGCGKESPTEPSTTEPSTTEPSTTDDQDGDGFEAGPDCDDGDAQIHPGADEVCGGGDEDCDGAVDEDDASDASTWYADDDGDGYGSGVATVACVAPVGHVANSDDCDDGAAGSSPAGTEVCGGADEDCDGTVDEDDASDASTWYADGDGDGYGSDVAAVVCVAPVGHVANSDDCDDGAAGISPAGTEVCGGADEDCDGTVDEDDASDASTWYADGDGDGYGSDIAATACLAPVGQVANSDDCDDGAIGVSPAATETCDGVDTDCDGAVDYGFSVPETFPTIQGAIDAASAGDHLCVGAGTYVENLHLFDEELVIEGYAGADATVLDGGGVDGVVRMDGGTVELRGVTLRNGYAANWNSAALYAASGADVWLEDAVVEGNVGVDAFGAAVTVVDSAVTLTGVEVRGNSASGSALSPGSMIWVQNGSLTMDRVAVLDNATTCSEGCAPVMYARLGADVVGRNVVIAGNTGVHADGAAWMAGLLFLTDSGTSLDLEHATITGNAMDAGAETVSGSILLLDSTAAVVLDDVVLAENDHRSDWGPVCGGLYAFDPPSSLSLTYTDVYGNSDFDWCGVPDPTGSAGNISVPPDFVDTSSADPTWWDLRPRLGSALVDAGDPAWVDADGTRSDIGAFGGLGAADWNGSDDDCDGATDEGGEVGAPGASWYGGDGDGDGHEGDGAGAYYGCSPPVGWTDVLTDCDDDDAGVNPAATETCDGADTDCDGVVDFGFSVPETFPTIQGAIDAASDGDHLCVAAGTYPENLVLAGEDLVIEGYDGAEATIVDAGGVGHALSLDSLSPATEISGLTLRNGGDTSGAGILAGAGVHAWLHDLVIADNVCSEAFGCLGTGLFIGNDSDLTLSDVVIRDNVCSTSSGCTGTGMFIVNGSDVTLANVEVRDNTSAGSVVNGGAVWVETSTVVFDNVSVVGHHSTCADQCSPFVTLSNADVVATNFLLAGNVAESSDAENLTWGALFMIGGATLDLSNATLTGNVLDAGTGGAGIIEGLLFSYSATDVVNLANVAITDNVSVANFVFGVVRTSGGGTFTITYTDVFGNVGPPFAGIADPTGTNGNVSAAPLYADVSDPDPGLWDLTLAAGSPLVDAGDPALLDADGSRSDIGAYGGPGGAAW